MRERPQESPTQGESTASVEGVASNEPASATVFLGEWSRDPFRARCIGVGIMSARKNRRRKARARRRLKTWEYGRSAQAFKRCAESAYTVAESLSRVMESQLLVWDAMCGVVGAMVSGRVVGRALGSAAKGKRLLAKML